MEQTIEPVQRPRPARDLANTLTDELEQRLRQTLADTCELPFPLHSPLPPDAADADAQAGINSVPADRRADLALRALVQMARRVDAGDGEVKTVGLPVPDVARSAEEWWARHPGWARPGPKHRLSCLMVAIQALCDKSTAGLFDDEAPHLYETAERLLQRDRNALDQVADMAEKADQLRLVSPQDADKLLAALQKRTLNMLAAGIFGTPELDALQPTAAVPVDVPPWKEVKKARDRLRQPGSRRALLSRLFLKLLRAHLALRAPAAGKPHALETTAISLLPTVAAHGAEPLRPVAALLMWGLDPQAPALDDDTDLPRCFGRETLQTPAALVAQARLVLLGTGQQPADPALADVLQAIQTLARTLARVVTDPLRAGVLGFDGDQFRTWRGRIEGARKANGPLARLQSASDDSAAAYLAQDFMPRLKRWKDHISTMGGQAARGAQGVTIGLADAVQQVLEAGTEAERASLDLPLVNARPGRLQ